MMCECGVYMIVCICMICVRGCTRDQDMQGHLYVFPQSCLTLCEPVECSLPGSSVHGIFWARNTGMDCHFLLQGIFLTQGSNPCLLSLLHWKADSKLLVLPGTCVGV